jgi:hypothetical protein
MGNWGSCATHYSVLRLVQVVDLTPISEQPTALQNLKHSCFYLPIFPDHERNWYACAENISHTLLKFCMYKTNSEARSEAETVTETGSMRRSGTRAETGQQAEVPNDIWH